MKIYPWRNATLSIEERFRLAKNTARSKSEATGKTCWVYQSASGALCVTHSRPPQGANRCGFSAYFFESKGIRDVK